MARFSQAFMVVLMSTTLFASHIAEAKRVGSGRSAGMQRQAAPAPQRQAAPQQPAPMAPVPVQQKKSSSGMMGGILGGLAVGGLLGYMMGNNASGAAEGDGMPWGTLLLLGALTAGGVMLLRRRKSTPVGQAHAYAGVPAMNPAQMSSSPAPAINPQATAFQAPQQNDLSGGFRIGQGVGGAYSLPATPITRLPDGTESAAFLRQARASFLHMQALNSPEQAEEMRRYMTPELFAMLKDDIASNDDLAEFPELNLNIIEAVDEGGRMVASVEFSGRVSESLNAPAVPFKEVWHFVRPMQGDPRWLLAGIQQI
ncbi:Tim44-like domain-containing protein [Chitinibacter sp. SCUT-21]|uniref:Tim44 domain-containing protein n=1 Tax=Chitinibacter sp. SCUT-21 TaxID=2970891 RepID=UPI0035A63BB0